MTRPATSTNSPDKCCLATDAKWWLVTMDKIVFALHCVQPLCLHLLSHDFKNFAVTLGRFQHLGNATEAFHLLAAPLQPTTHFVVTLLPHHAKHSQHAWSMRAWWKQSEGVCFGPQCEHKTTQRKSTNWSRTNHLFQHKVVRNQYRKTAFSLDSITKDFGFRVKQRIAPHSSRSCPRLVVCIRGRAARPLRRLSYCRAGMRCSGGRARLHTRAALAGGHVVLVRRACMLGYISRGFVAIVMKRPGLPWPLKGLPALNDLEAERRGSGAEPGCGPPPQWRNYRTSIPLAGLFTLLLFVSAPCCSLFLFFF